MTRRTLFQRLAGFVAVVALVPAAKVGPPARPVSTLAAGWDTTGYTEWSDGTRVVRPALKDAQFGTTIVAVARYHNLPIETVYEMPFMEFDRYRMTVRGSLP